MAHWLWEKLAGQEKAYLDTADAAKLVRERLKAEFPGVKFRVRTARYAGGSSVDVRWSGGPEWKAVQEIGWQYEFRGFDGMIDCAYHKSRWLLPDGRLVFAETGGTERSRGEVPARSEPQPHPEAVLVKYGPCYVSCQREREG